MFEDILGFGLGLDRIVSVVWYEMCSFNISNSANASRRIASHRIALHRVTVHTIGGHD